MGSQVLVLANLSGSGDIPSSVRKGLPIQPYIVGTGESSGQTGETKSG